MIEKELLNIIKKFKGFTSDMLYNDLVFIDNKQSEFNEEEYNKFIVIYSMFSTGNLSLQNFINACNNMSKINLDKLKKVKNHLAQHFSNWIAISSPGTIEEENILKIYLSIDNSDLHFFINNLLHLCLTNNYSDFDFKINNNYSTNRRDNVVIYCNEKNFGKYIQLLQDMLLSFPNIKFNSPHLLGIPYDDKIYCGIDYDNGKISYTDKMCQNMFKAINNGKSPEDIVAKLTLVKNRQVPLIHELAELSNRHK